jgi:hypothetical protein
VRGPGRKGVGEPVWLPIGPRRFTALSTAVIQRRVIGSGSSFEPARGVKLRRGRRIERGIAVSAGAKRTSITSLTRRRVIGVFQSVSWSGDLDDLDFLRRLYDLASMPSTDPRREDAAGDIEQHRLANLDWDDLWIFADSRFGLQTADDEDFLRFISETVHPEVRSNSAQAEKIVKEVNAHLGRDGWELAVVSTLSGYPIYGARSRASAVVPRPEGFPLDPEPMTASLVELLKARGRAREIAVLANSRMKIEAGSYDNWNGGTTGWTITLSLSPVVYARLSASERSGCEEELKNVYSEFFRPFENDFLSKVCIAPAAESRGDWRSSANTWLTGKGVTNQGRVRSDNIASLEVDGLLFRSEPEINLYRAFKHKGVTFAPLPVFLRGGESYARLEPDFVVLRDGLMLVVELDGDTFHYESPADAHRRLLPLDHEGAKIERVTAQECESPEKARACADRLVAIVDRLSKRR